MRVCVYFFQWSCVFFLTKPCKAQSKQTRFHEKEESSAKLSYEWRWILSWEEDAESSGVCTDARAGDSTLPGQLPFPDLCGPGAGGDGADAPGRLAHPGAGSEGANLGKPPFGVPAGQKNSLRRTSSAGWQGPLT